VNRIALWRFGDNGVTIAGHFLPQREAFGFSFCCSAHIAGVMTARKPREFNFRFRLLFVRQTRQPERLQGLVCQASGHLEMTIDLIARHRGARRGAEDSIYRTGVVSPLSQVFLNGRDIRVDLRGVTLIVRLSIRIIIVRIIIRSVIRVEIPGVIALIQTYPKRAVPAKPVSMMEVSVTPVPTLVLGATFARENVMPSG
jgi:hypothetical protein